MATYTSNYAWAKPEGSDPVDISVLNNNLDDQDSIVHNAYMQFAPVFSTASTYAVGDVVLYSNNLYKCITAVTVAGAWDATKWTQVKVSDICGGGGGGTGNYNDLTNQPQINGVTLTGNKSTSALGIDKSAVGLGNVPNVTTDNQVPTVSMASTRANIAQNDTLATIMGKIAKFFSDLKTVAFTGSYADLSNTPTIPSNADDITYDNTDSELSATDVQGAVDEVVEKKADKSDIAPEFDTTTVYAKGDLCYHEGTLYEFNQAHAAGAWNSAHADAVDIDGLIRHINDTETIYSTTADGVKTYSQLISELNSYMSDNTDLSLAGTVLTNCASKRFGLVMLDSSYNVTLRVARASGNTFKYVEVAISTAGAVTYRDLSANVVPTGSKFSLIKKH